MAFLFSIIFPPSLTFYIMTFILTLKAKLAISLISGLVVEWIDPSIKFSIGELGM